MSTAAKSIASGAHGTADGRRRHGRPEMLRRRIISTNAFVAVVGSVALVPVGLVGMANGAMLPFVIAVISLAAAFGALALKARGDFEGVVGLQVLGAMVLGAMFAVADPVLADFGLAIALVAPVLASLLGQERLEKQSWIAVVVVVTVSALGYAGVLPSAHPQAAPYLTWMSVGTFVMLALLIAYSVNRLNSAFEVFDKSQINAARHLLEHVRDAVMRFSTEGHVVFVSNSAEALFGCPRYELSGALTDRIHVLDRPAFLTAFAEANRDGETRTIEVRMRRDRPQASGGPSHFIWVEIVLSPMVEEEMTGGRHEVVAILRDVTARRDTEERIRLAHKQAEEASQAKSQFLANIGHELRTPLNAIVGFSELMSNGIGGELTPGQKEYAVLIRESGRHLLDVVNMLLDMSKIEAGRFELQTESFSPKVLVEPCRQIVEPLAVARDVRIVTEIPGDLPQVVADERACRQILINLLSNAVKFSNSGGEVHLSMKRVGQKLRISVRDQGIGMPADVVERIGEPFFQGQDGLARQYEGTGLGLSIVKGLVQLHDGSLHVASEQGHGTTMSVLLPLDGPAAAPTRAEVVTAMPAAPAQPQTDTWQNRKSASL